MMANHYTELLRKFQKSQMNCGVTLRGREDSQDRIRQRLSQLEAEGKAGTKEFQLLTIILERCQHSLT